MTALVSARVGLFTAPVSGTGPWREEELLPQVKTLTLHLKVKPESGAWLNRAAREVNQVWNWANATSKSAVRRFAGPARWLSSFELDKLSAGSGELFECITSDTVQRVNAEFVTRRKQFKKSHLRFRKSRGSKRALGWVPFKGINLRFQTLPDPAKDSTSQTVRHRRGQRVKPSPKCGTRLKFAGKTIRLVQMQRLLDHREGGPLGARLLSGNFAQNALGEWFLNVSVERPIHASEQTIAPREIVGIDPGLKAVVTTSDGDVVEPNRSYRNLEAKMAQAQRRGHKRQVKRLHRKQANQRLEFTHQLSRRLIDTYQNIKIGNVPLSFLGQKATGTAKAARDSGLGMLKAQLHTKGHWAGRRVEEVSESHTTRACSGCGARMGPTGLDGLVVRHWVCSWCHRAHDRDVNAAINIRDGVKVDPRPDSPCRVEVSTSVCGNETRYG